MARLRASWRTSLPVVQQPRNPQSESIARTPYQSSAHLTSATKPQGQHGWVAPALLGSAAALGAAALYTAKMTRDAERQHPPIGRFLDVDGVRLHYIEQGTGEPLAFIHGNGTLIQDFTVNGLVDRLSERYRVIVIERPGYGYSDRPRGLWTPRAHASLTSAPCTSLGWSRPSFSGTPGARWWRCRSRCKRQPSCAVLFCSRATTSRPPGWTSS